MSKCADSKITAVAVAEGYVRSFFFYLRGPSVLTQRGHVRVARRSHGQTTSEFATAGTAAGDEGHVYRTRALRPETRGVSRCTVVGVERVKAGRERPRPPAVARRRNGLSLPGVVGDGLRTSRRIVRNC